MRKKSNPLSESILARAKTRQPISPVRSIAVVFRAQLFWLAAYGVGAAAVPPGESVIEFDGLVENSVERAHGVPAWPASSVVQRPVMLVSNVSLSAATLVGTVLRMSTPGAARSTWVAPKLENDASASL